MSESDSDQSGGSSVPSEAVSQLTTQIAQETTTIQQLQQNIEGIKDLRRRLAETFRQMITELGKEQEIRSNLTKMLSAKSTVSKRAEEEMQRLQTQLEQATQANETVQNDLRRVTEESEAVTRAKQVLDQEHATLQQAHQDLTTENATLAENNQRFQKQSSDAQAEAERLQTVNTSLQQQHDAKQQALTELQQTHQNVQTQLTQAQQAKQQADEAAAVARNEKEQLEQQNASTQEQITKLKELHLNYSQELERQKQTYAALQEAIAQLRTAILEAQQEAGFHLYEQNYLTYPFLAQLRFLYSIRGTKPNYPTQIVTQITRDTVTAETQYVDGHALAQLLTIKQALQELMADDSFDQKYRTNWESYMHSIDGFTQFWRQNIPAELDPTGTSISWSKFYVGMWMAEFSRHPVQWQALDQALNAARGQASV
jgi:exonuclease SbcC